MLHDVRGGGLTPALVDATFLAEDPDDLEVLRNVVFLARDHTKMMRNAIVDLDAEARQDDVRERPHSVDDLVRTWDGRTHRVDGRQARVAAEADWSGNL